MLLVVFFMCVFVDISSDTRKTAEQRRLSSTLPPTLERSNSVVRLEAAVSIGSCIRARYAEM